jgi:hypothetical protein
VEDDGLRISASSLLRSQLSCAIGFDTDRQIRQTERNLEVEGSDQEELSVESARNGEYQCREGKQKSQHMNGKGMVLSDRIGAGLGRRMRSGQEQIREIGWRKKLELFVRPGRKPWKWVENSAEASPSGKILRCRCVREAESHQPEEGTTHRSAGTPATEEAMQY